VDGEITQEDYTSLMSEIMEVKWAENLQKKVVNLQ
jgi:hypothetical protein